MVCLMVGYNIREGKIEPLKEVAWIRRSEGDFPEDREAKRIPVSEHLLHDHSLVERTRRFRCLRLVGIPEFRGAGPRPRGQRLGPVRREDVQHDRATAHEIRADADPRGRPSDLRAEEVGDRAPIPSTPAADPGRDDRADGGRGEGRRAPVCVPGRGPRPEVELTREDREAFGQ